MSRVRTACGSGRLILMKMLTPIWRINRPVKQAINFHNMLI